MAKSAPNPPMSPMTSGRKVDCPWRLMRSTACSPAPMSTPAAAYVSPGRSGGEASATVSHGRGDLQHLLGQRQRDLEWVHAREARGAEPGAGSVDRGDEVL